MGQYGNEKTTYSIFCPSLHLSRLSIALSLGYVSQDQTRARSRSLSRSLSLSLSHLYAQKTRYASTNRPVTEKCAWV